MSRRRHTPEQIIRKLAKGQKLLAGGMTVEQVCRQFAIAESTWARWLGQYGGMTADDAKRLKELEGENARLRKRAFAKRRPRWGWRRAAKELRRTGWSVNNKRVRRLWRDEGLQVPTKTRKKRLAGIGTHVGDMSLIAPNALWALDFQFDHTIDGHQVKILNVIDEYTREALACHVAHNIDAEAVVAVLDRLAAERGRPPAFLRFDNGPEFVAHATADWCQLTGTNAVFIDPGSPWQNAWIESFNGRLRDELLNLWHFDSLLEAQVLIGDWRIDYNQNRPNSAHGDLTPNEFAQAWTTTHHQQPQAA